MMRSTFVLILLAGLGLAQPASSQIYPGANGAVLFEKYSFDTGLGYTDLSELTVPLTFSAPLGNVGTVTVSGGFANVRLTGDPDFGEADQELSGIMDTEARLVLQLIPDRLSFLATAVAPTGIESLEVGEETVLSALAGQVLGLSTTRLGGGGRAGGGFVAAVPAGDLALGLAATYTHSTGYNPVAGQPAEWKPGDEIRVRAGLEGNVGEASYLRLATIFATRQADELDGEDRGEIGNQFHVYGALNQGLGASSLTIYAFDSYRSAPQIEATSVGSVLAPKGNLLTLGAKLDVPVSRDSRFIPKAEFRSFSEAPREGAGDGSLESAGATFRLGADFKKPLSPGLALVLEASGLFGNVGAGNGETVGVTGFRGGVHLEYRR